MTQNLAQQFIHLRLVSLAAKRAAELAFYHAEHPLDGEYISGVRPNAAQVFGLIAWLALSGAATITGYRTGRIKTKAGAWLIWLLVFLAPSLTYLGLALMK